MNAVNELIEEAHAWLTQDPDDPETVLVPPAVTTLVFALSNALAAEHAEVERLRGELEALKNANARTVAKWSQEIGRVEALTAQLQAVRDTIPAAFMNRLDEYSEHVLRLALRKVSAILDAEADGGE